MVQRSVVDGTRYLEFTVASLAGIARLVERKTESFGELVVDVAGDTRIDRN